jgi:hypothetical protein
MKRLRSPNIINALLKNSRNAFVLSIEMHNRPIFDYRLQSVTIFLVHSWELILKAYCYKYLNDKRILQKDNDWLYQKFNQILDKIYHSKTNEFRVLKDNLKTLIDYRNLVMHSNGYENMDQLIYEFVAKSIFLYKDFIWKYFPKFELKWIEDTPILPIAFKLPYTPIDLLTNNFSSSKTSKEVLEFLDNIKLRIKSLAEDWIEESIFIRVKTDFVSWNNIKNPDLSALISNSAGISFHKENKVRFVNDKSAQPWRWLLTKEEREVKFPISTKKELTTKIREEVWNKWTKKWWIIFFSMITKELEKLHEWSEWYPEISNSWKRYSNDFYNLVIQKYE